MKLRYLINGKTDCLEVGVNLHQPSSILLHQPHQKGASVLPIQRIIIHILQTQQELRIGWECGWTASQNNNNFYNLDHERSSYSDIQGF